MPTPKYDKRVGKIYVLRPDAALDIKTDRGVMSDLKFDGAGKFLFLGVGKSVGRRFKKGFFKRGGSQKIHRFLIEEKIIKVLMFPYEFNHKFKLLRQPNTD